MKSHGIYILFNFKDGPYGGGNQFLKALKKQFSRIGCYEENPAKANVILLNSYQNAFKSVIYKLLYPEKIFIHRIDGPILKYRGVDNGFDDLIYKINKYIADGTIFQSQWSKLENCRAGFLKSPNEAVVYNASDPEIFNCEGKKSFDINQKIKLIAVSWSSNWNKGFEYYKYLDEYLDFKRFEMTFVGNSLIRFNQIKTVSPLNSLELAAEFKKNDIYITASKNDPCSNSLIEALNCGLPAIAFRSGGHPEIIKKAGELFLTKEELIKKINLVAINYNSYAKNISLTDLQKTAECYREFIALIQKQVLNNKYQVKKNNYLMTLRLLILAIFKK